MIYPFFAEISVKSALYSRFNILLSGKILIFQALHNRAAGLSLFVFGALVGDGQIYFAGKILFACCFRFGFLGGPFRVLKISVFRFGGVLAASDSVGRGCDEQEESIRAADRIAGISVFFMSVSSIIVVGGVFYLGNR